MPTASIQRQIKAAKRPVKKPAVPGTSEQRAEADVVRLLLPVPVSVNAIYERHVGGGVRLSKAYSAWLSEAGWRLTMQRPGRVSGRYQLTLRMPEESGLDLDNSIKAVSDLMQLHGVVRNDRLASRIVLEWQSEQPAAIVEVVPYDASDIRKVEDLEAEEIQRAITACGSMTEAAKRLGLGRSTLYRKIKTPRLPSNDSLIVRREA